MKPGLSLRTREDAHAVIEHFNGFHDGFVRELRLRSHDMFARHGPEPWHIEHRLSGDFDVVVDFAHYNYGETLQPPERVVRASFLGVRHFHLDLREVRAMEWPIKNVEIAADERHTEDGGVQACFALNLAWSRLDGDRWSTREARLLTFREAAFEEI